MKQNLNKTKAKNLGWISRLLNVKTYSSIYFWLFFADVKKVIDLLKVCNKN
jgi:hypothetical protein